MTHRVWDNLHPEKSIWKVELQARDEENKIISILNKILLNMKSKQLTNNGEWRDNIDISQVIWFLLKFLFQILMHGGNSSEK